MAFEMVIRMKMVAEITSDAVCYVGQFNKIITCFKYLFDFREILYTTQDEFEINVSFVIRVKELFYGIFKVIGRSGNLVLSTNNIGWPLKN